MLSKKPYFKAFTILGSLIIGVIISLLVSQNGELPTEPSSVFLEYNRAQHPNFKVGQSDLSTVDFNLIRDLTFNKYTGYHCVMWGQKPRKVEKFRVRFIGALDFELSVLPPSAQTNKG